MADFNLSRACMEGQANLALRHLDTAPSDVVKTQVTSKDADGRTPLHWASSLGNVDLVRALLSAGADMNAVDAGGSNPLIIASTAGHVDVVRELLYRGASPHVSTPKGLTPLHYTASKNHIDVARLLLEYGTEKDDINKRDGAKQCPIHRAASQGHDGFIRMLANPPKPQGGMQREKLRVNPADRLGNTPLHLALDSGHGSTAVLLIEELGVDRERQNLDGQVAEELEGVGGQEQRKVIDFIRSSVGPRGG